MDHGGVANRQHVVTHGVPWCEAGGEIKPDPAGNISHHFETA